MPGLCGIIDLCHDAQSLRLTAMARPLSPHPWFITETCEHVAGARLAVVSLDRSGRKPHLACDDDAGLVCVLDGEIYNAAELVEGALPRLAAAGTSTLSTNDAALLLAGWRKEGKAFFPKLNGSFSAVIWDKSRKEATFVNDRFGNRPVYYAISGDRLLFSSSIKSLTADSELSLDADPRGMAQFFTFGHYLGEDTSLANVKVFPAAAAWIWKAGSATFRPDVYHSWGEVSVSPGSESEWIERIGGAFERSVERQTAGTENLGLSLSGGLDARTILGAIDGRKTPVKTVCLGIEGSLDHRCAQRLADIAGCTNHSHLLNTGFLDDYRRHLEWMVRLTDGQYLSQCIVMPTLPLYRKLGIEVLLRGHAGELMHMYKAYNYSLDAEALQLQHGPSMQSWLYKRLSAYMLDGVTKPVFRGDLWNSVNGLARESLADDLAGTAHVDPPVQRIWQLFITQRLRRETVLSLNEFRSVAETRLPLLDNELIPLLLAAPPALKLGETIQASLLRRFRPEFLNVVNANTGTAVGAGPLRRKFSSLKLRALGKLGLPGYQPYERLGLWLKRELRQMVREILLDSRTLERGLYCPEGVRAVVDGHQSGRHNHTYLIMALMIFELGQRYLETRVPGSTPSEAAPMALGGVR